MIQLHQPANDDGVGLTVRPRPSVQLMKRVLVDGGHSIGQRVLVAGKGCNLLTEWLDSLGLEVDSLDTPPLESTTGDLTQSMYDLILVDGFDQYRDSLLDLGVRLATAQFLSRLRPGGDFVVIRDAANQLIGEPSRSTSHDAICWTRHLACFPGNLESTSFPASWFSRGTWHWLLGKGPRPSELMVSLRIPFERLTIEQWQDHARRGLLTGSTCCSESLPLAHQRRAA